MKAKWFFEWKQCDGQFGDHLFAIIRFCWRRGEIIFLASWFSYFPMYFLTHQSCRTSWWPSTHSRLIVWINHRTSGSSKTASATTLFPTMCPPASNIRDTTVASTSGTNPSRVWEPFIIGTPATHVLSLIATVLPRSLPLDAPLMSHRQYLKMKLVYYDMRKIKTSSEQSNDGTCWKRSP